MAIARRSSICGCRRFSGCRRKRVSINFDLANLLNRNDILGVTTTYGAAWQTPTTILDPRLFKLGVQFDF